MADQHLGVSFPPDKHLLNARTPTAAQVVGDIGTGFERPCDLNNAIHPIFRRDAFPTLPTNVYDSIQPSLRFASLALQSAGSLSFIDALVFEVWQPLHRESSLYRQCMSQIRRAVVSKFATPESIASGILDRETRNDRTRAWLDNFTSTEFRFEDLTLSAAGMHHENQQQVANAYGFTCRNLLAHGSAAITLNANLLKPLLGVRMDLTTGQMLAAQFNLAVTLAHELMHAIFVSISKQDWVWPGPGYESDGNNNNSSNNNDDDDDDDEADEEEVSEPFFEDYSVPELGYAWEMCVFGCYTEPCRSDPECALGLVGVDQPTALTPDQPVRAAFRHATYCFGISMSWLEKIMSRRFWTTTVNRCDPFALKAEIVGQKVVFHGGDAYDIRVLFRFQDMSI